MRRRPHLSKPCSCFFRKPKWKYPTLHTEFRRLASLKIICYDFNLHIARVSVALNVTWQQITCLTIFLKSHSSLDTRLSRVQEVVRIDIHIGSNLPKTREIVDSNAKRVVKNLNSRKGIRPMQFELCHFLTINTIIITSSPRSLRGINAKPICPWRWWCVERRYCGA